MLPGWGALFASMLLHNTGIPISLLLLLAVSCYHHVLDLDVQKNIRTMGWRWRYFD